MRLADILAFRAALFALVMIAAMPLFFIGIYGVVIFQRAYVPVIVDWQVTRSEKLNPTRIEIWGEMTKRFEFIDGLPMCQYQGMSWWARLPDGKTVEARWWTLERPFGQVVNRPTGRQSFGPWMIDFAPHADATEVYGISEHWCLGFWPTQTMLGPLKLVKPPV